MGLPQHPHHIHPRRRLEHIGQRQRQRVGSSSGSEIAEPIGRGHSAIDEKVDAGDETAVRSISRAPTAPISSGVPPRPVGHSSIMRRYRSPVMAFTPHGIANVPGTQRPFDCSMLYRVEAEISPYSNQRKAFAVRAAVAADRSEGVHCCPPVSTS